MIGTCCDLSNSLAVVAFSGHAAAEWYLAVTGSQSDYIGTMTGTTPDGNIDVEWNLVGPNGVLDTTESSFTFQLRTAYAAQATPPIYRISDPWPSPGSWSIANQQAFEQYVGANLLDTNADQFVEMARVLNLPVPPPPDASGTFRFPARENLPPLKLTWYEGTRPPRPEDMDADVQWPAEGGVLFKGSKGALICGVYGGSPKLLPLSRHLDYKRPSKRLPRIADHCHELDWVRAIKSGRQACASFAYSGPLTETCLLGNVAKRLDGPIEWDAANLKVRNSETANRLIRTQYRAGWSL